MGFDFTEFVRSVLKFKGNSCPSGEYLLHMRGYVTKAWAEAEAAWSKKYAFEPSETEPSPTPIEPTATVEPKLEEPLSEGWWWIVRHFPEKRVKCRVTKLPAGGDYIGEVECRNGGYQVIQIRDDGGTMCGVWQLIRRVIEPTVAPLTPKQAASLLTETIRRKRDGKQYRVTAVSLGNVTLWPPGMPCSDAIEVPNERLADKYEHLDGSPCGTVSADPWDAPA